MTADKLPEKAPEVPEWKIILFGFRDFVIRNYLPCAFLVAFIWAMVWPWLGQQVLKPMVQGVHVVTFINICIVFFISGLTLRTDELKASFTKKTAAGTIFGVISILGITPTLGFGVKYLPYTPDAYATGMAIFCIVPTTLGIGVSLVTSAKGNVALAIFLTVATNVLGVLLIPLWLKAVLSNNAAGVEDLSIDYVDIFVKLLLSFFVPTVIGKLLREFVPLVMAFQREHKLLLSIISNTSLAMLIWQTLSSAQDQIVHTDFGMMLLVIVSLFFIHWIYIVFNTLCVIILRAPLPEAITTVIMASQKSAPVAVTVITYITSDTHTQGILCVPCVIGQLVQIFVGQPIAHYLSERVKRWEQKMAAASAKKLELPSVSDLAIEVKDASDNSRGDDLSQLDNKTVDTSEQAAHNVVPSFESKPSGDAVPEVTATVNESDAK